MGHARTKTTTPDSDQLTEYRRPRQNLLSDKENADSAVRAGERRFGLRDDR